MKGQKKHRQRVGYNYHHIIPRSRNGQNTDENMLFLKMEKHHALHRIFGNMTPTQIVNTLKNFERDFEIVFGKVSFIEASKIFERLLKIKGGAYDTL